MHPGPGHDRGATAFVGQLFAGIAIATVTATLGLLAVLDRTAAPAVTLAGGAVLAAVAVAAWLGLFRLAQPLDRVALDLAVIARDNPRHALRLGGRHSLRRLAAGIEGLRQQILGAEESRTAALRTATQRVDEQKRQLEAILLDLSEGIVVCNMQHQVLLYNEAAAALFEAPLALGLGRSLFSALTQEPILHMLERKREHGGAGGAAGSRFVCGTIDSRKLFQARLGVVRDADGQLAGYVLAMREAGAELAAMARRDDLLQLATQGLRGPLANLRAAAETLVGNPELSAAERAPFDRVVMEECAALTERIEALARGYRELGGAQWFLAEVHSSDLLASLRRRLEGGPRPIALTPTGLPAWLYADSLSLLLLLEHVLRRLQDEAGIDAVDAALTRVDKRIQLDLIWPGRPVGASVIDRWLDEVLVGGLGPLTGRMVLLRHGSELWSQPGRASESLLRLPLPSAEPAARPPSAKHPARPEFYDFDLLRRPLPAGAVAERPLRQLTYVVFDLETTGLRPSEGDEAVQIAAVRVVNGRVLTMETFDRLVNPGRPVPAESTRIHGITGAMVRDKPPLGMVLPQFQAFAADSVLVAHNAAFDMAFVSRAATTAGVRIEQPIIDTLLLSAHLDPNESDHSLDGIAARLGLAFTQRHDALGDALVTAAILVRLIERLEERGFKNLRELIDVTGMAAEIRGRQQQF